MKAKRKIQLSLLLLLGALACGDSETETGASGGGGQASLPVCDDFSVCADELVERIYALPCYPQPGPAIAFVPPQMPAGCSAPFRDYIICAANDPASLTCEPGPEYSFVCDVCSAEREALDAACGGMFPCE